MKYFEKLFPKREKMVKVTKRHRDALLAAARKETYLRVAGVKKWEGYDEAIGCLDMDGFDEDGFPKPPEGKQPYE